eukprot:m.51764 g.51764  ORF g.51764 m.51764 type:complete len:495 (-) comp7578_c2_seq1:36-1520(-)
MRKMNQMLTESLAIGEVWPPLPSTPPPSSLLKRCSKTSFSRIHSQAEGHLERKQPKIMKTQRGITRMTSHMSISSSFRPKSILLSKQMHKGRERESIYLDHVFSGKECVLSNRRRIEVVQPSCSIVKQFKHEDIYVVDGEGTCDIYPQPSNSSGRENEDYMPIMVNVDKDGKGPARPSSIEWCSTDAVLVCGYQQHIARIDLHHLGNIMMFEPTPKTTIAKVATHPLHSDIFASGGFDGSVHVWDMRSQTAVVQGRPQKYILSVASTMSKKKETSKLGEVKGSSKRRSRRRRSNNGYTPLNRPSALTPQPSAQACITGLSLLGDSPHIVSSSMDGSVCVWDLRRTYSVSNYSPTPYKRIVAPFETESGVKSISMDAAERSLCVRWRRGNVAIFRDFMTEMPKTRIIDLDDIGINAFSNSFDAMLSPKGDLVFLADGYTGHLWKGPTFQFHRTLRVDEVIGSAEISQSQTSTNICFAHDDAFSIGQLSRSYGPLQ